MSTQLFKVFAIKGKKFGIATNNSSKQLVVTDTGWMLFLSMKDAYQFCLQNNKIGYDLEDFHGIMWEFDSEINVTESTYNMILQSQDKIKNCAFVYKKDFEVKNNG